MINYYFSITDNETEAAQAMDVDGYSHMSPARFERRKVYFASANAPTARQEIEKAMGWHRNKCVPVRV